jgi:hypothetical protein
MHVHALLMPAQQAAHREAVPQIVDARRAVAAARHPTY